MKTPAQILETFAAIPDQDMIEYVPFLKAIAGGQVLEIGVCGGVSTSAFLIGMDDAGVGRLVSIDKDPKCGEILSHPRWTFICDNTLTMAVPPVTSESFDVLLIDGDHAYESVASDLRRFSPLVRVGGLILNHDVDATEYGMTVSDTRESRKAWEEFRELHPTWEGHILPGLFGLGVIKKTCAS